MMVHGKGRLYSHYGGNYYSYWLIFFVAYFAKYFGESGQQLMPESKILFTLDKNEDICS